MLVLVPRLVHVEVEVVVEGVVEVDGVEIVVPVFRCVVVVGGGAKSMSQSLKKTFITTAVEKNKQPTHTPGRPEQAGSWSGPVETDFQG